jgi:hypothetical protein
VEKPFSSVTPDMKRTLIVFIALVGLVFLFDLVSRRFLGLDCIGPVLPVWGCVAQPYPTTFGSAGTLSGSILTYGGLLGGALLAAFLVRNLVFTAAGYLLGRYRPDVVARLAGEEEPRGYRVR